LFFASPSIERHCDERSEEAIPELFTALIIVLRRDYILTLTTTSFVLTIDLQLTDQRGAEIASLSLAMTVG